MTVPACECVNYILSVYIDFARTMHTCMSPYTRRELKIDIDAVLKQSTNSLLPIKVLLFPRVIGGIV